MSDEMGSPTKELMLGQGIRNFSGCRGLYFNPNADAVCKIHGVDVNPLKYAYIIWGGNPPRMWSVREFDSEAEFDAWTVAMIAHHEEDRERLRRIRSGIPSDAWTLTADARPE